MKRTLNSGKTLEHGSSCLCARYGGNKFIILLDVKSTKSAKLICERIRKYIDETSEKTFGHHLTISAGAAKGRVSIPYETSLTPIINEADKKLQQSKKSGKNNWRC
ncbi:diguanylate cyclase [Lentisphaerota bacterium ZTH]|nr:diguanylate cyclase [Lentisphaerota bacterium]WET05684.1 diguanylate cyclase [Lentisphaerota bacterium ZTH]